MSIYYRKAGYTYEDVANIKIIGGESNPLAEFWMRKGAITLGPVVVLKQEDYNQLIDPNNQYNLYDLLTGIAPDEFSQAVEIMVHEMVHVNQYAELGRETFTTNYLLNNAPLVTDGYGFGPFEQEAYGFENFIVEFLGGEYCNAVKYTVDWSNNEFLNEDPVVCQLVHDTDGDMYLDHLDNCPATYNPGQEDQNANGVGDVCDVQAWLPPILMNLLY